VPVNITLLLLDCDLPPEPESGSLPFAYSHSMLQLDQDYDLDMDIQRIPESHRTRPPLGFGSYLGQTACGEAGYGDTVTDSMGRPIYCLPAGRLARAFKGRNGRRRHASPRNAAAGAWLAALPPEQRVALVWE
jgi:hypothetical protein